VFGDHCSPISDTTVLSALASDCRLEDHVWTQIPYAFLAAAMELLAGDLLCGYAGAPWWLGMAVGTAGLVVFVYAVGRPAQPAAARSR
jgi:Na+/H+ antiporter NhaC